GEEQTVKVGGLGKSAMELHLLDEDSFQAAATDPGWLEKPGKKLRSAGSVKLGPYAVARLSPARKERFGGASARLPCRQSDGRPRPRQYARAPGNAHGASDRRAGGGRDAAGRRCDRGRAQVAHGTRRRGGRAIARGARTAAGRRRASVFLQVLLDLRFD